MTGGGSVAHAAAVAIASALWVAAYLAVADGDGVAVLLLLTPAVLVAAGVAGRWGRRRSIWLPAAVPPVAAMIVLGATGGVDSATAAFIGLGALLWSPWLVGRWLRARAELADAGWHAAAEWEDRARDAEDDARRRERERIAARTHDLVGHDLARAALALGAIEVDADLPGDARRAVAQARERVSSAADHLAEAVHAIDAAPSAAPEEGELEELVRGLRADGADVGLVPAEPSALLGDADPATAGLVVRVAREALTNALKHGDGPVEVSLARRAGRIAVVVRSRGADAAPTPGSGRGLVTMRRDVEALGGTLQHGPSGGDYVLAAHLPARPAAAAEPTGVDDARWAALGGVRRSRDVAVRGTAAVIVVSVLLVLAYRVVDVSTSVLAPATFDALRIGDARADVAGVLPPRTRTDASGVPRPPGVSCEHYSTSFDLVTADLYRLCWTDGALSGKDRLRRPAADPGTIGT